MDGQGTRCARCGASGNSGVYCTHCGAALGTTPEPPPEPAYDDTSTHERIPAVPRHAGPQYAVPAPAQPPPAGPPPAPRRSPGVGLWVAAAAALVVVLLLGGFLLLHSGSTPSSSRAPTLLPPPTSPSVPSSSSAIASSPTSTTTQATKATKATGSPSGPAADVAGLAQASAPRHAPAGVDFAGRPVTFVASNMVDGAADTCWRATGDATGILLTFRLDQPTVVTKVGLINGYAKTVFPGGRRFDWYHGDRRVLAVEWLFDDGTTVSQRFSDSQSMQTMAVTPVTTSTVRLRITGVTRPGRGPAARNDTPISEIAVVGRTA